MAGVHLGAPVAGNLLELELISPAVRISAIDVACVDAALVGERQFLLGICPSIGGTNEVDIRIETQFSDLIRPLSHVDSETVVFSLAIDAERVVAVEVVAVVEVTAEVCALTLRTEEFRPVAIGHGLNSLAIAECEPHVTTVASEGIGEDGILEDILVAVIELHGPGSISTPVARTADEVVRLSNVHRLDGVTVLHHIEGDADLLRILHVE